MPAVIKSWREGSVVKSWLLDLLDRALDEDPSWPTSRATPTTPARAAGPSTRLSASPCRPHVIAASLFARFQSRQEDSPAMKAVAALRNQFGGHAVKR